LWLSRENEASPTQRELRADELLDELSEDLNYLLQDKPVVVKRNYEGDLPILSLPETPLRIVLSNLLRNAFQYTCEGEVMLEVSRQQWSIENHEQGEQHTDSDNSFGLGLMLVKQICERLEWSLALHFQADGVRAVLALSKEN
jgi:signal transduction histidine kinase